MATRAAAGFSKLLIGVEAARLVQWPNHRNVGDHAIGLGECRFFSRAGVHISGIYPEFTVDGRVYNSTAPVVINGGGNLGGLYPQTGQERYELCEKLRADTLLIQLPQSICFVGHSARREFLARMASRSKLRIGVRDAKSFQLVESDAENVVLSPDAVHFLGRIPAPDPTQRVVVLARRDKESAAGADGAGPGTVDWAADAFRLRVWSSVTWRGRNVGPVRVLMSSMPSLMLARSRKRLARGVELLAGGETIITDRLHAALLGLQIGRSVIAVDNNNSKLSAYADTWFGSCTPDLRFARTFDQARRLAEK